MSSLKSLENYLMVDHRAGPGMPDEWCQRNGLPLLPGGKLVEIGLYTCCQCQTQIIPNPWRQRERNYCRRHHAYICDNCAIVCQNPDFVHRSWQEVCDLVREGKAVLLPGSTHGEPKLLFLK